MIRKTSMKMLLILIRKNSLEFEKLLRVFFETSGKILKIMQKKEANIRFKFIPKTKKEN